MRLARIPVLVVSLVACLLSATGSPGDGAALTAKFAAVSMDGLSLLQAAAKLQRSGAATLPAGCADLFDGLSVYSIDELLEYCLIQLPEGSCVGAQRALGERRPWSLEREGAACRILTVGLKQRAEEAAAASPGLQEQATSLSLAALQLRRHRSLEEGNASGLDAATLEKRDYRSARKVGDAYLINCSNVTLGNNSNGEQRVIVPPNESLPRGCWVAEDYWKEGDVWNGTIVRKTLQASTAAPSTGNESEVANATNETAANESAPESGPNNTGAAPAPPAATTEATTAAPADSGGNTSAGAAPAPPAATAEATTAAPTPAPAAADNASADSGGNAGAGNESGAGVLVGSPLTTISEIASDALGKLTNLLY